MRLDTATVDAMRALIAPLDTEDVRAKYRAREFPRADAVRDLDKRYRWDLFYAARAYRALPDGVADAHIDTALRRIVSPLSNLTLERG